MPTQPSLFESDELPLPEVDKTKRYYCKRCHTHETVGWDEPTLTWRCSECGWVDGARGEETRHGH